MTGAARHRARQSSGSAILDFAIIGLRKERAGLLKAGNITPCGASLALHRLRVSKAAPRPFWDAALDHSTSVTEQWSGRVVDVKADWQLLCRALPVKSSTGPADGRSSAAAELLPDRTLRHKAAKRLSLSWKHLN